MPHEPASQSASTAMKIVLVVRFLLLVALVIGVMETVMRLVPDPWRMPLAMLAGLAVAVTWWMFFSPSASMELAPMPALIIESLIFVVVSGAMFAAGLGWQATAIFVVWLVNRMAYSALVSRTPDRAPSDAP